MTMAVPKADSTLPVSLAAAPPIAEQESFVINLCSSTTPMALTQPELVELKQYKFFVSRRLEDGRERFRLHMGHFDSLLQAEELLPLVRDIYPGAWAGEAPGKRLRAKIAAAAPAPVVPAAPVGAAEIASPVAGLSAEILANTPTLSAAPALTPTAAPPMMADRIAAASEALRQGPGLKLELVATPPRVLVTELPVMATVAAPVVLTPPPAAITPPPAKPTNTATRAATRPATPKRDAMPFDERSNVREVLKSLDESARKTSTPTPLAAVAPVAPTAAASPAAPAAPLAAAAPPVRQAGVLPESQVLHLLEEKRGDPLNTTSTPAAFSVQLQWSVQPIDLAKVPSLAIFGAYTLYTVEGSRDGRRWFGLRLGFFTDANSAKQVAQYVRSEFSSVAVVPVSLKERDGASGATGGVAAPQRTTERLPSHTAEFKLLDDTGEPLKSAVKPKTAAAAAAVPPGRMKAAAGAAKPVAGRLGGKGSRRGNRVHASEKRAPQTLEETLEILGADQLQMEGARAKLGNEGQVRHLDMKVQKNSPFTAPARSLAERNR
ncbi:MAG: hypothetical protein WDM77_06665 [Steroidobacteraceae bacterium]